MSENSEKREIGTLYETGNMEIFRWKICNVSSMTHKVDYFVQSPPFFYEGATWVFKLYPYGQSKYDTEGYIDVVVERLSSDLEVHKIFCQVHCETAFTKKLYSKSGRYIFENMPPSFKKNSIFRLMKNLNECPEKSQFAENDTFTLVFKFGKSIEAGSKLYEINQDEPDLQIESNKTVVDKRYVLNERNERQEIGELTKDTVLIKCFHWKVCMRFGRGYDIPFPKDCQLQSKPFCLDRTSWILKLYPYFLMEESSKPACDVILERLHSEIPEHHVTVTMSLKHPTDIVAEGSFFFSSSNTDMNAVNFQFTEEVVCEMNGCLHFDVEICIQRNSEIEPNFTKAVK